jgi:hypothetical protein
MKITKTQLQNIIREELDALSEDEQLDEFFGPFSKKAKAKAKAKAAYDAKRKTWAQEDEEAQASLAAMEKEPPPKKRGKSTQFGGGTPGEPDFRANKIARDRKYAEEEAARRRRASGKNVDYARKTDRYGTNNRKDESKVRQRIREEVAKAVKAHFNK